MQNTTIDWRTMPDTTRVWIYQSSRAFSDDEVSAIDRAAASFVSQWSSHGSDMAAVMQVFHKRFLVLFADEAQAKASGCGIDKSVRFVQQVQSELGVDFFDRMTICYLKGEEIHECKLPQLPSVVEEGTLTSETLFFDNLVPDKGAFVSRWTCKMGDSWTARYF